MMRTLVKRLIEAKVYINRTASYLGMLNTGMLLLLVLAKFKDYGFDIRLETWGIPIYLGTLALFLCIGYLDVRLGLMQYENTVAQKANAELSQIKTDVEDIKRMLTK